MRRLTAIDWERPFGDAWYLMSVAVGWTAGGPQARMDLSLWAPHRFAGERKFSLWAEPEDSRAYCPREVIKPLVNVISAAERDYWVDYLRIKRQSR